MNEKMLKTMVDAAAVKRARIVANGARFHVEVDAPGRSFTVETGKGSVRTWTSIDSAAKWLRNLGIGQVALELAHWQPGQKSLLR
jgi:hypothetical protein